MYLGARFTGSEEATSSTLVGSTTLATREMGMENRYETYEREGIRYAKLPNTSNTHIMRNLHTRQDSDLIFNDNPDASFILCGSIVRIEDFFGITTTEYDINGVAINEIVIEKGLVN